MKRLEAIERRLARLDATKAALSAAPGGAPWCEAWRAADQARADFGRHVKADMELLTPLVRSVAEAECECLLEEPMWRGEPSGAPPVVVRECHPCRIRRELRGEGR